MPFEGWLQGRAPYGLYFPLLAAMAWFTGIGPTVVAAVLSLAAAWWLFVPDEAGYEASLGVYLLAAGSLIALARVAARTRRRADDALVVRERLAAIVDSSDDAIIGKSLEGIIQSWNAAAERLFGYTAAEIVGRSIMTLIPAERRAEEDMILGRLRRGERVDHFETVRVAKDGRELELSLTISPIRDGTGAIVGASKIAREIGERKRAERVLAEQREWLRVTLDSIGDAVIATDRNALVTFLNPVAARLTGWSQAEAQGLPLTQVMRIINERTREVVDNPCERVLRTGAVVGLANHTSLIARDGTERPIEDSAAPIIDDRREVRGVVLVFHDVTERKRAEREHEKAERERDHLLQSERAARGEAERANRLKDDFVAMLSHELRTPLNAVLGWAEILRREPRDPNTLARGLTVIERNTRMQAQLISDLLDVSRIVSGKLSLELQPVRLGHVIEDALDALRPSAEAKEVMLESSVDPSIEAIAGDPSRLQQIVWNLLSNAVKFSSKGGRVLVRVERDEPHVKITVSDQGVGIPAAFLPLLFDRFRQADASATTRRHGGLGLGLTIVKQLVELHGGTVAAQSEGEGKGATFVVRFPLHADTPEHHSTRQRTSTAPERVAGALSGLTVIVVEDEPDTRELIERLLSEAGCRVVAVASAAAAMHALTAEHPDVLVSDIGLPGEDGYSLIRRIRNLDRSAGGAIPAIAVTAFARSEDRTRALRAGFQAHIAKPVDPAELIAIVNSFAKMVTADRRPSAAKDAPS